MSTFLDFLRENRFLSDDVYSVIRIENCQTNSDIFDVIVNLDILSEYQLANAKSKFFNHKIISLETVNTCLPDALARKFCIENLVIPFRISENEIGIAIYDPSNILIIDFVKKELYKIFSHNIKTSIFVATKTDILSSIKSEPVQSKNQISVDNIIIEALAKSASDIHITPFDKIFIIQFRVNGTLELYKTFHKNDFLELCIKIKVISKLNISENRRPQSGHFSQDNTDFRVSFHPTKHGENVVIRLLSKDAHALKIDQIGFCKEQIKYLKIIAQYSDGMIIFCGPTGSGKTTSIYSILDTISKSEKNIMTLEDPIEYNIKNVKQTEIKDGLIDFVGGVKSILRQDPDVIFIGEVRDEETAKMAIRASMTGHLVFTTIHSNDSLGAITRFVEFGIQKTIICDNIIAIIAQRLIRKTNCADRTIISEILKIDKKVAELICGNAPKDEIIDYAKKWLNFRTIQEDCEAKIKNGLTTTEEMNKILRLALS